MSLPLPPLCFLLFSLKPSHRLQGVQRKAQAVQVWDAPGPARRWPLLSEFAFQQQSEGLRIQPNLAGSILQPRSLKLFRSSQQKNISMAAVTIGNLLSMSWVVPVSLPSSVCFANGAVVASAPGVTRSGP